MQQELLQEIANNCLAGTTAAKLADRMPALAERAVLMRVSIGLPGKSRKDRELTDAVKSDHKLGQHAGAWIKIKYPKEALEPLEKLATEARAYHAAVTLPYDAGIGILPAGLIMEYGDKMREFRGRFENLRDAHFAAKYQVWVDWARQAHNGTFDASDYALAADGSIDPEKLKEVLESFYFRTEPVPVPDASHYEGTIRNLLGADAESTNARVKDAMTEAQRELMRRLIGPVKAMAEKLKETPKGQKEDIIFRDSLVGNIREIVSLAPKLNIAGDPTINGFIQEMSELTKYEPEALRKSKETRADVATKAVSTLKRLEAYKI